MTDTNKSFKTNSSDLKNDNFYPSKFVDNIFHENPEMKNFDENPKI